MMVYYKSNVIILTLRQRFPIMKLTRSINSMLEDENELEGQEEAYQGW